MFKQLYISAKQKSKQSYFEMYTKKMTCADFIYCMNSGTFSLDILENVWGRHYFGTSEIKVNSPSKKKNVHTNHVDFNIHMYNLILQSSVEIVFLVLPVT